MTEVTVWLGKDDDTTASDIQEVIDGDVSVFELTAVDTEGNEVTVRFLRSDEKDENDG